MQLRGPAKLDGAAYVDDDDRVVDDSLRARGLADADVDELLVGDKDEG